MLDLKGSLEDKGTETESSPQSHDTGNSAEGTGRAGLERHGGAGRRLGGGGSSRRLIVGDGSRRLSSRRGLCARLLRRALLLFLGGALGRRAGGGRSVITSLTSGVGVGVGTGTGGLGGSSRRGRGGVGLLSGSLGGRIGLGGIDYAAGANGRAEGVNIGAVVADLEDALGSRLEFVTAGARDATALFHIPSQPTNFTFVHQVSNLEKPTHRQRHIRRRDRCHPWSPGIRPASPERQDGRSTS